MENTWIVVLATIVAVFFLELIIVVLYDPKKRPKLSSFLDKVLEKTKGFVTNRRVWKVFGTGVGLGIVFNGILVLGYYSWHWISNWGSSVTAKPMESAVSAIWYNMPVVWIGAVFVGVACFLALLIFLQKRLKPGTAKSADDKEDNVDEKKSEGKDKNAKKVEEDDPASFFDDFNETWYGKTFIYTSMTVVLYAFLTWGLFNLLRPALWKWLWIDHNEIFWLIPITILFSVLAFSFKHRVAMVFGIIMILFLTWAIMDEAGATKRVEYWLEKREAVSKAKAEETAKSTLYKLTWTKPPGFVGGDTAIREESNWVQIIRNDDTVFEIVVTYTYSFETHKARMIWDKTLDSEKGTWSRRVPQATGTWFLKETSKGRFSGQFTDDRYPGTWMLITLEPDRHEK